MGKLIDLSGQRFGRLTVIERASNGNCKQTRWLCRCDCGEMRVVQASALKNGTARSCGCLHKDIVTRHGETGTRLHNIWRSMKRRCDNPNCREYKWYGGKGVHVCKEWSDSFEAFRDWALANGYSDDLSIDRIDGNRNYEPSNCRWATPYEQQNNKSNTNYLTILGVTRPLIYWVKRYGLKYSTVKNRISYGWTDPYEILFGRKKKVTT